MSLWIVPILRKGRTSWEHPRFWQRRNFIRLSKPFKGKLRSLLRAHKVRGSRNISRDRSAVLGCEGERRGFLKGIFSTRYYPLRRIFHLILAAIERESLGPRAGNNNSNLFSTDKRFWQDFFARPMIQASIKSILWVWIVRSDMFYANHTLLSIAFC